MIVFITISAMSLAQKEKNNELTDLKGNYEQNFFIDGAKLKIADKKDVDKIKNVISDFSKQIVFCGFLKGYGNTYNITVTATGNGCFTWVFSRNGKVTSMQSVQAWSGQSYNGYSTNGDTVGISCECLF